MSEKIKRFYQNHYKKLFAIPLIIVAFSLFVVLNQYFSTGEFVNKDVSLKGGLSATIYTQQPFDGLNEYLKLQFPKADIVIRQLSEFGSNEQVGILVEASDVEEQELKQALESRLGMDLNSDIYSVEIVGSSLGEAFYSQMTRAILLAFIFMAIVIFIAFRQFVPSFTVVFCAFCDMIFPIAIMNLLGMRLSTTGIAALLMLIGYSVDTDIVITTKALKRKEEGSVIDRMYSGVATGLTMTITTLAALTVGYFVSQSYVIKEMFIILILGLLFDIIMTYLFNAGVLVWWVKRGAKE